MRTLMSAPPTNRVGRYPKHTFLLESAPFVAQPFFFAPVLPGETLDNLFFESRVVSDPVMNKLIGWKKEYYYFYCRITDLMDDEIRDMFISPENIDIATTGFGTTESSQQFYTAKGGVDYPKRAYNRIVSEYFRDQGEAVDVATYTQGAEELAIVQNRDMIWLDSATDKDDMPVGDDPGDATNAADLEALNAALGVQSQQPPPPADIEFT